MSKIEDLIVSAEEVELLAYNQNDVNKIMDFMTSCK